MLNKTKNYLLTFFVFLSIILLTGCPNMPEEFTANIPPVLSSPSDGSTNISIPPVLIWKVSSGADSYGLQVSLDNSFSSFIFNQSGITTTSKQLTGLINTTTYYWRANSTNSLGTSSWSNVWSFTTAVTGTLPDIPILSTPADGSMDVESAPTLSWNPSNGASTYTLQVSTTNSFSSYIYNQGNITTTSKQVTGLTTSTQYYWRVNATNSYGTADWSVVWGFTTGTLPAEGLVAYYPFNSNANDESGNGNNGTVNGAVLTKDRFGVSNKAFHFNGTSSITTNLKPGNIFSISLWYTKEVNQNDNAGIFSTYSTSNYRGAYYAVNGNTDWIRCDNNSLNSFSNSRLNWQHIVIISDGTNVKVYQEQIKKMDFAGTTNHASNIVFGDSRFNGRYLKGNLDDIRIYNKVLTTTEIETLYHEGGW